MVDGAGNFQGASQHVNEAVQLYGWPIQVVTFEWSHGFRRIIADQTDFPYARAKGKELASQILACRRDHPEAPIFVLAHSAGAGPALAALEHLPPDTVKRVILISPSVSAAYPVRRTLAAVREGLHNFYSEGDRIHLGLAVGILGNIDGPRSASAGRIGFQSIERESPDFLPRLFQRKWTAEDELLGNDGGHFGNYRPEFMRQRILPLLQ